MTKNKGFSLVELIIVIAIIAILSAALAPQIMKYIEKARVSTDKRTCQSLKSCLYAALTNDDGTITNTFSIGDIVVQTSSFKFNTDISDAIYVD